MIYLAFLCSFASAICLSVIGAYFSISGLTLIFAGAAMEITILAIILEFAKVSIAAWVHIGAKYIKTVNRILLKTSVGILMFLTSLGIYGYMSRAHLENQSRITTTNAPQLALLNSKIENLESLKTGVDSQIAQIDKSISQLKGNVALNALSKQRTEKNKLVKQQQEFVAELIALKQERTTLGIAQSRIEMELGPLKYVIQAIPFVKVDDETAFRLFVLLIMLVFDPLAILLITATAKSYARMVEDTTPPPQQEVQIVGHGKYPEVDLDKFFKYNANINPNTVSALDLTKAKI